MSKSSPSNQPAAERHFNNFPEKWLDNIPDQRPDPVEERRTELLIDKRTDSPSEAPAEEPHHPGVRGIGSLDSIGQRDEVVRQRIALMIERLDDIQTLKDSFTEILEPIVEISEELPRASARIVDLETSLSRQEQISNSSRKEIAYLNLQIEAVRHDLSKALERADYAESRDNDQGSTIEQMRISLNEKMLSFENLERQIQSAIEQNKSLVIENKALKLEAQASDAVVSRCEHDLVVAHERASILEQDNRRLQALGDDQATQLAALADRVAALTVSSEAERQRVRELEERVASETSARERVETQYGTEMGVLRTEKVGLIMKLEAANGRAGSNEQLLAQVRGQLRERDELFRSTDRSAKEAAIARATSERRLEGLQAEFNRQSERLIELQKVCTDTEARSDMLGKALAAKDAALEQTTVRHASMTERLNQLISRQESERAEFEIANRRLVEDLQREKSERSLIQGALEIARESRAALQKQHEALRRMGRDARIAPLTQGADETDALASEEDNVRPFNVLGKENRGGEHGRG